MLISSKLGFVLVTILSGATPADEPVGPLPVEILDPRFAPHLLMPALPPPPRSDGIRLSLDAGTGQVWKGDKGPGGEVGVSAQTVILRFAGQWSLAPILSAGWEVPFLFHARSFKRWDSPFHLGIEYDGATLADLSGPTGGISDASLTLSLHHRSSHDSLRLLRITAALKVPSGGRKGFIGTGEAEVGGFLDVTLDPGFPLFLHGRIGLVRHGEVEGLGGGDVKLGIGVPFRAGLEWRAERGFSLHFQIEGSNNIHPVTGNERLDEHPVQVTLGASLRLGTGMEIWLGFSEDLTRGAPDFPVSAGVSAALP